MPITPRSEIRRMSQQEFGELAYMVMGHVFAVHRELGRLFDEKIYKRELAYRVPEAELEVPVEVRHESFMKMYFVDLLVSGGGLFELKAAEAIVPTHRAQTLNYLYLANLGHAKLVNMRPEQVEHEFVNTTLTSDDRLQFQIDTQHWDESIPGATRFAEVLTALHRDWGTGLQLSLYEEALTHFLGGDAAVLGDVEVQTPEHALGHQTMHRAAPRTAFVLTALTMPAPNFETHARRLLGHTHLEAILWANLGLRCVTLSALR